MIYLASPYSHQDKQVEHQRYTQVQQVMAAFMSTGVNVYSPIVLCHPTALEYNLPTDAKFWENYNNNTIRRCDALWVLCLDGWKESKGVTEEIKFAKLLNLQILFISPDGMVISEAMARG